MPIQPNPYVACAACTWRVPFLGLIALAIILGVREYRKSNCPLQWQFAWFQGPYLAGESGGIRSIDRQRGQGGKKAGAIHKTRQNKLGLPRVQGRRYRLFPTELVGPAKCDIHANRGISVRGLLRVLWEIVVGSRQPD